MSTSPNFNSNCRRSSLACLHSSTRACTFSTEISVTTNRRSGENNAQVTLAPSYVWRVARRVELLIGVPVGLTSSTEPIGGVLKFTFELGEGHE
jgi:hypothetical protein